MKVSVVTVCYNSQDSIESTLNSVRNQDYHDIEHLVKDGGSKDNTLNLIRKQPSEDLKLVSGRDAGIYDAINIGLNHTTGEIIGLMHSDDAYTDNFVISDIVKIFEDGADVVYGNLRYVSKENTNRVIRTWITGPYREGSIRSGWMPPHPTVYMTRKVYLEIGNYRTEYKISSDYDYMVRLFSRTDLKIGYLNRVIVDMTTGGASNRDLKSILRKTIEDAKIMLGNNFGFIGMFRALVFKNTSKISQFF